MKVVMNVLMTMHMIMKNMKNMRQPTRPTPHTDALRAREGGQAATCMNDE